MLNTLPPLSLLLQLPPPPLPFNFMFKITFPESLNNNVIDLRSVYLWNFWIIGFSSSSCSYPPLRVNYIFILSVSILNQPLIGNILPIIIYIRDHELADVVRNFIIFAHIPQIKPLVHCGFEDFDHVT